LRPPGSGISHCATEGRPDSGCLPHVRPAAPGTRTLPAFRRALSLVNRRASRPLLTAGSIYRSTTTTASGADSRSGTDAGALGMVFAFWRPPPPGRLLARAAKSRVRPRPLLPSDLLALRGAPSESAVSSASLRLFPEKALEQAGRSSWGRCTQRSGEVGGGEYEAKSKAREHQAPADADGMRLSFSPPAWPSATGHGKKRVKSSSRTRRRVSREWGRSVRQ
jgi:hypothetical protein